MQFFSLFAKSVNKPPAVKGVEKAFPYGYSNIHTSGEGLLCGLYAIMGSMQAQHPTLLQPELESLKATLKTPRWPEGNAEKDWEEEDYTKDTCDFMPDQLALILAVWQDAEPGKSNLQLGYS